MEPAFTPILVDRQNSGRYCRRPELPWRFLICCVKISFLNTSPGLSDEQPHMQLCAKRDRAPGWSLKKYKDLFAKKQAGLYKGAGLPIILCTDDKGVFSCSLSGKLRPKDFKMGLNSPGEYLLAASTFPWDKKELFSLSRCCCAKLSLKLV